MSIATGKKNLSQICKVLAQISSGLEFGDDEPSYVPINDFVRNATQQLSAWFLEGVFYLCLLFFFWSNEIFQLQIFLTRRPISMLMNSWMPLYSPNRSTSH